MRNSFKNAFADVIAAAKVLGEAVKQGLVFLPFMVAAPAMAQGLVRGVDNLGRLTQMGITVLIALGMLAGLGFILGACLSLYKKYDRGNDDITWGKVGMQFLAGGLCMALSWVGVQIVETMGGSASDIGRSF